MIKKGLPIETGMYMPGEFEPHRGTILIWPVRPGSWGKNPVNAQKAFLDIAGHLCNQEEVYLLADNKHINEVETALTNEGINAKIVEIETNDSWARDVAPTFVKNDKEVAGINWKFNAWGGLVDGLYMDWDKDDAVPEKFCKALNYDYFDASDFVLEGGSIHSDGDGTVMVTESCLLSAGRNPQLTKEQIEQRLKDMLGAKKVLWLPRGIYLDETNEHIDNVCAFTAPGEVVLAWTDNEADPQYELSKLDYEYLSGETDARGRKLIIHKLPIPDYPICCSDDDCGEYDFEEGEDVREPGDRLAASYVNFYFGNGVVIVPQFGGDNAESDKRAISILQGICKDREVIGVDGMSILLGGGNVHCITQQIPKL